MTHQRQAQGTRSLFFLCLGLLAFASCSRDSGQPAPLRNRNVLLISIDTLRADYVGAYGGGKARTPTLDALAADGLLLTDAVTPVPMTLPAHASMLTGLHPVQHGVRDNFIAALSDGCVTLPELFRESGYDTAGVIGAILLSRRSGLAQGFDFYDDEFTAQEFQAVQPTVERKAERVVSLAEEWLTAHQARPEKKPFLLFLHFYDPHMLYQPPSPFREKYKGRLYGGEVAYTDAMLGRLMAFLKQNGLYEDLTIWVTGDHGEGLGDHGEFTHGLFLYEETVRIPMIVKLPAPMKRAGLRIDQSASLLDITPTLIEMCGLGRIETAGRSLARWLAKDAPTEKRELVLETQYPLTYQWSPLFALRDREYKFIQAPRAELYALRADPAEKENLLPVEPARVGSMKETLEEDLLALSEAVSLQPENLASLDRMEALTSLGYAAGAVAGTSEPAVSLPDPKDKLEVYQMVDQGLGAAASGNFARAVDLFEQAMREDPDNPTPYMNLGLVYARQTEWDRAQRALEQALERAPGHPFIRLQLARILAMRESRPEAREILQALLRENPRLAEAHAQLGQIALQEQRYEDARKHFEDAKQWMPDMPGIEEWLRKAGKTQ